MAAMRKMSERQRRMLVYLEEFMQEHGYPPSIRQIQAGLGLSSTSVVDYNLTLLEKRNMIRREPHSSRSITMVGRSVAQRPRGVPLLGSIAAGEPIPVPGDLPPRGVAAETIELPPDLWPDATDDLYALRVRGDSMIDAFIADGDVIILRRRETAHNGEMVAVWLRDRQEVTLKRFFQDGRRVRLQPENPTMGPIFADARDVEIQGQVVGVIRRYP
jgi:repressor LexA